MKIIPLYSSKMSSLFALNSILNNSVAAIRVGCKQNMYKDVLLLTNAVSKPGLTCSLSRHFHLNMSLQRERVDDRRKMLASLPNKDEGTEGELTVGVESIKSREDMFPNEDTPNMLFEGVPFKDIPVCNIRSSHNNTIISLTDIKAGSKVKLIRSCGVEGFKNTRKGTNVAAQATAITFSTMALNKGYRTVRVNVSGLGPGRMSAIKGLQMGGLQIISVSDTTPVSENPPRPPRPKSL